MVLPGFTKVNNQYTSTPLSTATVGGAGGTTVVDTHGAIATLTDSALAAKFANADDAQSDDLLWVGTSPNEVLHRMKQGATDARLAVSWGPATAMTDLSGLATSTELNAAIARVATLESAPSIDLTPYARKTELPDLTPYARSSDIPDVSNFITSATLVNYATAAAFTDLTNRVGTLETSAPGPKTTYTVLVRTTQYDAGGLLLPRSPGEPSVVVESGVDFSDADYLELILTVSIDSPDPIPTQLVPIAGIAASPQQVSLNIYAVGTAGQVVMTFSNPAVSVAAGQFYISSVGGSWNPGLRLTAINLWNLAQIEV